MKKYLFILLSLISINSLSLTEGEFEVIQDINSNVADLETNVQLIHNGLNSYLFSEDYQQLISNLSLFFFDDPSYTVNKYDYLNYLASIDNTLYNVDTFLYNDLYSFLESSLEFLPSLDFLPSIFYHLSDNWQDVVNGFFRNHTDLLDVRDSIHDLEMKQEGYLSGISVGVESMGTGISDIIDILRSQLGSSESDLPIDTVGYYSLFDYGKDVNIDDLNFQSFTTTGEYNKDVLGLLIQLNKVSGSQMNASLSVLTNVQEIASSVSGDAEGKDKAENDVEERQYKAESAINEADSINSMNWESYFTPPKIISDVYSSLSISMEDTSLPDFITVIDTYHYNSESFTCEISDIGFSLSTHMIDLAYYARMVFGFIYWTLAFGLALFIFYWWLKLYFFVSKALFEK